MLIWIFNFNLNKNVNLVYKSDIFSKSILKVDNKKDFICHNVIVKG